MSRIVTPYRRAGWPRVRHGSTAFHVTDQKFVDPPAGAAAPTLFDDTSLSLNGNDETGTITDVASIDWTTAFSLMTWSYIVNLNQAANDSLWYFRVGSSTKAFFQIDTNTGTAKFQLRTSGGTPTGATDLIVANAFRAHMWDQFVCVWDGTDMFIYRNGVEIGTTGKTGTAGTTSADPKVFDAQAQGKFRGFCSQYALWVDNGLTAAEVTTLYNSGTPYDIASSGPDASDIKCWLRMGNGTEASSGATVYDMSGNGNDMTMVNITDDNYKVFSPEAA